MGVTGWGAIPNLKLKYRIMFDTKHYHEQTNVTREVVKQVNVQEHRAPTDESVRILQEMQEKALESIICAQRCENNVFNYNIFIRRASQSVFLDDYEMIMEAKINNKTYRSSCMISSLEFKKSLQSKLGDMDFYVLLAEKIRCLTKILVEAMYDDNSNAYKAAEEIRKEFSK